MLSSDKSVLSKCFKRLKSIQIAEATWSSMYSNSIFFKESQVGTVSSKGTKPSDQLGEISMVLRMERVLTMLFEAEDW